MDDPCFVDGGVLVVALLVAVPPVAHCELVQQQLKLDIRRARINILTYSCFYE